MQTLTTLQELKIDFFQMTQTAHGQRRSMFTFQRTHMPPCNVLQIQMTGSPWGTLNLQSGRLTCKFGISNIQFVHMLSKSAFLFYFSFSVYFLSPFLSLCSTTPTMTYS